MPEGLREGPYHWTELPSLNKDNYYYYYYYYYSIFVSRAAAGALWKLCDHQGARPEAGKHPGAGGVRTRQGAPQGQRHHRSLQATQGTNSRFPRLASSL